MKVYVSPQPSDFPKSGGVRTHLVHLNKFLNKDERVELVSNPNNADILHVESAFPIPNVERPILYVCHGGFVPMPMRIVTMNLTRADKIVSVSRWIADRYFPQHDHKTVVIPNGIDPDEYKDIAPSGLDPGFILYGKDYDWDFQDFYKLIKEFPGEHFVSTFWPSTREFLIPKNATYIGQMNRSDMRSVVNDCKFLVMTGSEVCPTMVLEAWACGKPVFARGIDGNQEIMTDSDLLNNRIIGGMLYDGNSMLVEFDLMLNTYLDCTMIRVDGFHWDLLASIYIDQYQELL